MRSALACACTQGGQNPVASAIVVIRALAAVILGSSPSCLTHSRSHSGESHDCPRRIGSADGHSVSACSLGRQCVLLCYLCSYHVAHTVGWCVVAVRFLRRGLPRAASPCLRITPRSSDPSSTIVIPRRRPTRTSLFGFHTGPWRAPCSFSTVTSPRRFAA